MTDLNEKEPKFLVIGDLSSKELAEKMKCNFINLTEIKTLSKFEVMNKIYKKKEKKVHIFNQVVARSLLLNTNSDKTKQIKLNTRTMVIS